MYVVYDRWKMEKGHAKSDKTKQQRKITSLNAIVNQTRWKKVQLWRLSLLNNSVILETGVFRTVTQIILAILSMEFSWRVNQVVISDWICFIHDERYQP